MVLAYLVIAWVGLCIGSFVNAVVWRVHEQEKHPKKDGLSISRGRSMCPKCSHELAAKDLLPVFSWLALKGKCRYCGKPISWQYPMVELLTAVLFLVLYQVARPLSLQSWLNLTYWYYLLATLLILVVYDLRWRLLPDRVLLPAVAVAGLVVVGQAATGGWSAALGKLLAALAAGGVFYALAAVSDGRWMGGGDIKLVFLMGLILGPAGTALALVLAFNSAAVVGIALIISRFRQKIPHYLAFGPFLAAGTVTAHLFGSQLISWYLQVSGLKVL